jgi:hypothetical protein
VRGLFADHDVVLLGEQHRIKHDAPFVQELLPRLAEAGVNILATEFARREDLAREVLLRQLVPWGIASTSTR